jgi:hypothetical protein
MFVGDTATSWSPSQGGGHQLFPCSMKKESSKKKEKIKRINGNQWAWKYLHP